MKQKRMEEDYNNIDISLEFIDQMKEIQQKMNENYEKKYQKIYLIGYIGSGKTSMYNFLSTAKFNLENDIFSSRAKKENYFTKQGDSMKSITFEPNSNMIDFLGLKDTNRTKNELSILDKKGDKFAINFIKKQYQKENWNKKMNLFKQNNKIIQQYQEKGVQKYNILKQKSKKRNVQKY